jgi:hypothetical protein
VHVLLGDLWRAKGNRPAARDAYEHALSLNPNLVAARDGLAILTDAVQRGGSDELPA